MVFIDDAFFELPDAATEEEAEGGWSQSQYSQQSQGGESEGSQSSQGSHSTARSPRRGRHNRRAAQQFMDRLRFELLLGHNGGRTRDPPTGQASGDDGTGSADEKMPDRAAEPGPSERPSEEGHPNDASQTDDDFTVMDIDEEQPEGEASQPPRKRGRFENERSDSMGQGEGASQQHTEDGGPVTYGEERARTAGDERHEGAPPPGWVRGGETRGAQLGQQARKIKADWLDERPTSNGAVAIIEEA